MQRKPNTSCATCGTAIYRRPIHIESGNVYCSLVCTGKSQRVPRICRVCKKEYFGNKRTCSRTCANTSRTGIKYTGLRKNDKAYVGALLKERLAKKRNGLCERCSENNYAILQVHHKKERSRGGTDALNNLELLCPNCHAQHHLGFDLFKK